MVIEMKDKIYLLMGSSTSCFEPRPWIVMAYLSKAEANRDLKKAIARREQLSELYDDKTTFGYFAKNVDGGNPFDARCPWTDYNIEEAPLKRSAKEKV